MFELAIAATYVLEALGLVGLVVGFVLYVARSSEEAGR